MRAAIYHGSNRHKFLPLLQDNDIILTTYETVRSAWRDERALHTTNWHRLVLDEGKSRRMLISHSSMLTANVAHHIRNRSSQIFKAVSSIRSRYRWCLTGTPIHNSLDDYGALLSFLGVHPFREQRVFDFWITKPLRDNKPYSWIRIKDLIKTTCLRANKDSSSIGSRSQKSALYLINILRFICDHGIQLLPQAAIDAWITRDSKSGNWETIETHESLCLTCGADIENVDPSGVGEGENSYQQFVCSCCASSSGKVLGRSVDASRGVAGALNGHMSFSKPEGRDGTSSTKVQALLRNLCTEQALDQHQLCPTPIKRYHVHLRNQFQLIK